MKNLILLLTIFKDIFLNIWLYFQGKKDQKLKEDNQTLKKENEVVKKWSNTKEYTKEDIANAKNW